MQNTEPSLRSRQRARTWAAIHDAAAELSRKNGVKATTAESIAEQAGVSPRTFFNYFATKEDAMLGLREPAMGEDVVESIADMSESNLLAYAAQILLQIMNQSFAQKDREQVRRLVEDNPELRQRLKIHMLKCENELKSFLLSVDWEQYEARGVLIREAAEQDPDGAAGTHEDPSPERVERVRALVLMAAAVLRHIDFGAGMSTDHINKAIEKSVSLFTTIAKEVR